jgi:hypothetical protein
MGAIPGAELEQQAADVGLDRLQPSLGRTSVRCDQRPPGICSSQARTSPQPGRARASSQVGGRRRARSSGRGGAAVWQTEPWPRPDGRGHGECGVLGVKSPGVVCDGYRVIFVSG